MRCPDLHELPVPLSERKGWPWTEGSPRLSLSNLPRISIIVPSYQQGSFLEETLRSILLQGYPDIEIVLVDGGSTDETLRVIERYASWISWWVSEKDRGQTHALNKGLEQVTGTWIGWQNSDDYYAPLAFAHAMKTVETHPEVDVIYGTVDYVDESSHFLAPNLDVQPLKWENMLEHPCCSNQSLFFHRSVFDSSIRFNESRRHYMDWDLYCHLVMAGKKFAYIPEIKGAFRQHAMAKSSKSIPIADAEAFEMQTWLLKSALPQDIKEKILEAMKHGCLNDFGKQRFPLFRQHVRQWLCLGGWQKKPGRIIIRYFASFLGAKGVRRCKQLFLR